MVKHPRGVNGREPLPLLFLEGQTNLERAP